MNLRQIPVTRIRPNKDNPRRIDIVTEDDNLSYLIDSIKQYGVLVPIVVTPQDTEFLLLDGERRYHAAKAAGLKKLPAYILESESDTQLSKSEVLFRMFQIHHLREQWGPIQQCFALETVYRSICRRKSIRAMPDNRRKFTSVVRVLAEKTGIDNRTAGDRVKFLRWPDTIKGPLYSDPEHGAYSYILEIEDKIVIPALTNYPEYFAIVPVDDIRESLFSKLNESLAHAQEVRQVAPYFRATFTKKSDRNKVESILTDLSKSVEMTYEDARQEFETAFPDMLRADPPSPKRLLTMLEKLDVALEDFDVDTVHAATGRGRAEPSDIGERADAVSKALRNLAKQLAEAAK